MNEDGDADVLDMPEYDPRLEDRNFSQTTEEIIGFMIDLTIWLLDWRGLSFLGVSLLTIALIYIL